MKRRRSASTADGTCYYVGPVCIVSISSPVSMVIDVIFTNSSRGLLQMNQRKNYPQKEHGLGPASFQSRDVSSPFLAGYEPLINRRICLITGRSDNHLAAHPLEDRPANLSEDEPDMMSLIMKDGKFALYVLKDRPTVPRIIMHKLGTTPATAVESVEFIGFGEPTEVSLKTPYKAYKVRVTDLVRGYSNHLSKFYVPHIGTTTGEILHVQKLTIGCVIEYAQCYVTFMEEDKVFDRLMKLEWTAKPSNTDRGAIEDPSEIRSLQNDAEMVSQSLDEQPQSDDTLYSDKEEHGMKSFKHRVHALKNTEDIGEEDTSEYPENPIAEFSGKTTQNSLRRSTRGKGDPDSLKCAFSVVPTNSESRPGHPPTKSASGVDLYKIEVST
ncbi:hypothetical protein R1sor_002191 [Riccia sorocarpa]|uniref:Uncharacterized protein n=1 Tax=Riccia sorocarpa TaxID=122646 RepID=A0ABD3H427_9MARC